MSKEMIKYDLEERLVGFAVRIIRLVDSLPKTNIGRHIGGQIVRSGTAPAAHYGEAQGAESKADFIHKMRIALKESRETRVWLLIIQKAELIKPSGKLADIIDESNQLISIFVASIGTARKKKQNIEQRILNVEGNNNTGRRKMSKDPTSTFNIPCSTFNIPKGIAVGVSAGGLAALSTLLPALSKDFPVPVIVVQHVRADSDSFLVDHLDSLCHLPVREAVDKMDIEGGVIYIAPPGYHLLVEEGGRSFALSVDQPVHYSRPAVDVLFGSAARVWGKDLIGIVLTGANSDGAKGLARIKELGGLAIVQDPRDAENDFMPKAAIEAVKVDEILSLKEISEFLNKIGERGGNVEC